MPGSVLHAGAPVTCSHGGQATPTSPVPRVRVMNQPVATIAPPYNIAGCTFSPPAGNGPCVTGQWTMGAVRVKALGQPLALQSGVSTCVPTGTPMLPLVVQTRVIAT